MFLCLNNFTLWNPVHVSHHLKIWPNISANTRLFWLTLMYELVAFYKDFCVLAFITEEAFFSSALNLTVINVRWSWKVVEKSVQILVIFKSTCSTSLHRRSTSHSDFWLKWNPHLKCLGVTHVTANTVRSLIHFCQFCSVLFTHSQNILFRLWRGHI